MNHRYNGNCWESIQSYQEENVCIDHDEPRGDCEKCNRCEACDKEFKPSRRAKR